MSTPTYTIAPDSKSITCNVCGRTSHNPNDVRHFFCGHCKISHDSAMLMFVVYHDTSDYPKLWPVRRFILSNGQTVPDVLLGAPQDLEAARQLIPAWAVKLDRNRDDDPKIMEVWL